MCNDDIAGSARKVIPLRRLELAYAPQPWAFAMERRADIEAHFDRARTKQPGLWNGQVLMMHHHRLEQDALVGAFLATDFASFLAWRDWGFPEAGAINCFSMGALRTSDGAWIMGVMAPHTAGAGKIYFPAGTPDLGDVVDGMVDLRGSVIREVAEETGLTREDFIEESGWYCVVDGARIALMKMLQVQGPAEKLRQKILRHIAHESTPELADVRVVRSRSDFDPMMPRFVTAFVEHAGFEHTRS
jgi:8-oxo-dGTP pyrophosphatase MutT (NUDIX family)